MSLDWFWSELQHMSMQNPTRTQSWNLYKVVSFWKLHKYGVTFEYVSAKFEIVQKYSESSDINSARIISFYTNGKDIQTTMLV